VVEIRDQNLALCSFIKDSELEDISAAYRDAWSRPSSEWHTGVPSFLTGPALANAPFTGLPGGVDILDANTGRLRLRIILREPIRAADSDGGAENFYPSMEMVNGSWP
jgi:hypothetical protein